MLRLGSHLVNCGNEKQYMLKKSSNIIGMGKLKLCVAAEKMKEDRNGEEKCFVVSVVHTPNRFL